jgi:hypothetical protein
VVSENALVPGVDWPWGAPQGEYSQQLKPKAELTETVDQLLGTVQAVLRTQKWFGIGTSLEVLEPHGTEGTVGCDVRLFGLLGALLQFLSDERRGHSDGFADL